MCGPRHLSWGWRARAPLLHVSSIPNTAPSMVLPLCEDGEQQSSDVGVVSFLLAFLEWGGSLAWASHTLYISTAIDLRPAAFSSVNQSGNADVGQAASALFY